MRVEKWPRFQTILCSVDFSEHSQRALRYAAAVARKGRGVLHVLYVNDPLLVAAAATSGDRQLVRRSAIELREFIAVTFPGRRRTQPRVKADVSVGGPAEQILKAAAHVRADLVVLGTQGLTGAERWLMGSTALSVLRHAPVPVLAVPAPHDDRDPALPPSWPRRIVAAIDLGARPAGQVRRAAHVARWFGASLVLAHVIGETAAPPWLKTDLRAYDRIRIEKDTRALNGLAAIAEGIVKTDVRVACGRIADQIAALAGREDAGVVITELHDRRGWFGAKRGSITYHVLTRAVTPVLACPPGWLPR